jgi:hypothetical protein
MPSGIIKENLTSFCFLRLQKRVATGLSNVARGWAVYYITTTETPRELIGEQVSSDGRGRFGRPRAEPALVVAVLTANELIDVAHLPAWSAAAQ